MTLIRNALLFLNGRTVRSDFQFAGTDKTIAGDGIVILPGFVDVHVHLREPGFSYKETIADGTRAAAHGGYVAVCSMPNLNPVPDSLEHLHVQQEIIDRDACIRVLPYGAITVGEGGKELTDMEALAPHVCAFSDDGRGVQNDDVMRAAMRKAKQLGKLICAHCEDNSLLRGGYIHDGAYARAHGHRGICAESEWRQVARDLELARETGCGYHVCHISTKESVDLIRRAKREGVDVTCETAPHYLTLTEDDLREDGNFKMNPPLRTQADREALIGGLLDGTIDMIATDHAPHSAEEKSRGLEKSPMGIVGLETAFSLLYTRLVRTGVLTLEKLTELMHTNPCRRFGIQTDDAGDYTVFDLERTWKVEPERFLSRGHNTPYAGETLYGTCLLTTADGRIVWSDPQIDE